MNKKNLKRNREKERERSKTCIIKATFSNMVAMFTSARGQSRTFISLLLIV